MVAISYSDFLKYGCPFCGCNYARNGNVSGGGTSRGTCKECDSDFVILADDIRKSSFGFGTNQKNERGETIFEYPELQPHPRKGIPWHPYTFTDPRPEYGEYWSSRGIGYDLSGFIKSKQAGERLLMMVKEVLGKDNSDSWLDYREHEPEWIQFKFQKSEFDLEKLHLMATSNNGVLTKEILEECKIG